MQLYNVYKIPMGHALSAGFFCYSLENHLLTLSVSLVSELHFRFTPQVNIKPISTFPCIGEILPETAGFSASEKPRIIISYVANRQKFPRRFSTDGKISFTEKLSFVSDERRISIRITARRRIPVLRNTSISQRSASD